MSPEQRRERLDIAKKLEERVTIIILKIWKFVINMYLYTGGTYTTRSQPKTSIAIN